MYQTVCTVSTVLDTGAESVDSVLNENATAVFLLTPHSVTGHKAVIATVLYTHGANVVSAKGLIKENKN